MRCAALIGGLLGLTACPPGSEQGVRVGVDRALTEMGLGAWLEASFEAQGSRRADLRFLSRGGLDRAVRSGEFDAVLLLSGTGRERLDVEGVLVESKVVAHEEFLFIGPSKNLLGKYARSTGAELLKNMARTNYRYLEAVPDSPEGVRHDQLFQETGDRVKPGSWFATSLSGVDLVRAAVDRDAFALVRRSSVLLAAREGIFPHRIWAEGDPDLVLNVVVARVHPAKAGARRFDFYDWLVGEGGLEALRDFGQDHFGHPVYALGKATPGVGATSLPLGRRSAVD